MADKSLEEVLSSTLSNETLGTEGSFAKQVGAKVAFVLAAPFGPTVSQGVAVLFRLAVGGEGDQDITVVKSMLVNAVTHIEHFIQGMSLDEKDGDSTSFFDWVQRKIARYETGNADNEELASLIDTLEDMATGVKAGTLSGDLARIIRDDKFVRGGEWVDRSHDTALSFVMVNLSAQFIAFKLIAMLSSQLAANMLSAGITAANEELYNHRLKRSNDAIRELWRLILGVPPATIGVDEYVAEMRRLVNTPYWASAVAAGSRLASLKAAPAFTPNMLDFAERFGWVAAVNRLLLLRKLSRLAAITVVDPEGVPGLEGQIYSFTDAPASYYYRDSDFRTVQQAWLDNLTHVLDQLKGDYASEIDALQGWGSRVAEMLLRLPPDPPTPNTVVRSTRKTGVPSRHLRIHFG